MFLFGCAIEPEDGVSDEPTNQTRDAFSGSIPQGSLAVYSPATGGMGAHASYSTFLTGLAGNLDKVFDQTVSVSTVNVVSGINQLLVSPDPTYGSFLLQGSAISVNTVSGRTTPVPAANFNQFTQTVVNLGLVTAHRRCFLVEVHNPTDRVDCASTLNDTCGFNRTSDWIQVSNDGTNWKLTANGNSAGSAACVDVTTTLGAVSWAFGSEQTFNLGADVAGKACFMTGVGGQFRANSSTDGVSIYKDAGVPPTVPPTWRMHVSANKFGAVECDQ